MRAARSRVKVESVAIMNGIVSRKTTNMPTTFGTARVILDLRERLHQRDDQADDERRQQQAPRSPT